MKKILIFLPCFTLLLASCNKDTKIPEPDCSVAGSPSYTGSVKALLDAKCATSGCHNASTKANGMDFSTYPAAKSHAAHDSFSGALLHAKGFTPMPNSVTKLSDSEINLLRCWVKSGSKE